MTSTDNAHQAPAFPMPRDARCPFDPPPGFRALQKEGPLTRVRLPDGSTPWAVTRYEHQRALLADPRVSTDPRNAGFPAADLIQAHGHDDERTQHEPIDHGLSFDLMDDPEHARLRRMVTGAFTVKRVEALRPSVQKTVDDLIDAMLAGPKPVDLVEAFALPLPSLVICELLGVPYRDRELFQEHSKAIVDSTATARQRSTATGAMAAFIDTLLGTKLTDPADDLLSQLAARVAAGELPRTDAARIGVLLLLAGHETTANMIALGTLALLEHPDQFAQLSEADAPETAARAVEELLRYLHIPHKGMRRCATEDIDIDGQTIRAGEGLILLNELGNRDAAVFAEPDRLDITRDARRHVTFGFGVHQCLGQPLARMELQVVYSTLYKRIPTLARAVDLSELSFKNDSTIYGLHALPVTW
ncbi:cytochrome P450 [Streptomyces sp. KhCrAH-43]|uniref:cytochrome P450 n=1 Tax=unclassified Streptomyces TaxID=2593676 RepID=UPI000360E268|nr:MULTISPECIES: cytochrome P450 [unclassified Streptomyces]MYS36761.1 cytochrome P450 [Streptomyces sp. SID4920]MYX69232.1 cytochrome P450 [Streptomyces sp. SID8373]RAJ62082.1 cytochrome P450 [Streptomyces sp. KhCrAH-43]